MEWTKKCEDLGAGEIVVTDIERDGTNSGLNIEVSRKFLLFKYTIDICRRLWTGITFVDGFKSGNMDAISAANFFWKRSNIFELRAQLLNSGINLRQV